MGAKRAVVGSAALFLVVVLTSPAWAEPIWKILAPTVPPTRFKVSTDGQSVLDKETRLLWEQAPDAGMRNWFSALLHCYERVVSGRKGWRVPTLEELSSVLDPGVILFPALPAGHPFTNFQNVGGYWSMTTQADLPSSAYRLAFVPGGILNPNDKVAIQGPVWCVRGGQGVDAAQ